MRTINISAGDCGDGQTEADRWQQLSDQCGGDEPIRKAIGYLSLWNWSRYPRVDIVLMGREGALELIASYREKEDQVGYAICAVWHGDHFGFHS